MGLFDGLFGNGFLGGLGGMQNMTDQERIGMQQQAQAQQDYYNRLQQALHGQPVKEFQTEFIKAPKKKFDIDEADIIDAEFEIINEVKALPEPE